MYRFLVSFIRSLKNNPKMFFINVTSFSIGLVAVILIYLFVVKEFRTDKFHKNHQDIYRVLLTRVNGPTRMSKMCSPMGELLKNNYEEIQEYCRYTDRSRYSVLINEAEFRNQKISFVDRSFFKMFDFPLEIGDYTEIFEKPNCVIIDRETALKYYNTINVVGKIIKVKNPEDKERKTFTIVGVLSDYPEESTFHLSLVTDVNSIAGNYRDKYFQSVFHLFLQIQENKNMEDLRQKFATTYFNKLDEFRNIKTDLKTQIPRFNLQKLSDMYLHSNDVEDYFPKGDYILIWVLIIVGTVLMVVTFINYIVLSLGLSLKNQKQNHIHQVLGGSSKWLKKKYVYESMYYVISAFIIALLILPFTHNLTASLLDIQYDLFMSSSATILLSFGVALIILGIVSGFVQYVFLNNHSGGKKNLIANGSGKSFFKYLIQFQLFVFIVSVVCLSVIIRQVKFIREQDLGFDAKNTISVSIEDDGEKELFMQEFESNIGINHISVGHTFFSQNPYLSEVTVDDSNGIVQAQCIFGDHNYLDVYRIKLLEGTNINGDKLSTLRDYFRYGERKTIDVLVNECFVKQSGLKNPLGTMIKIDHNGRSLGLITGVIKDVKNLPFYYSVTPMVIGFGLSHGPNLIVSVKEGYMDEFKAQVNGFIKKIDKEFYPGYETHSYDFEGWYKKEQTMINWLLAFSVVIVFILILGLVGISLFIAERKTKEIGVRKINGANIREIVAMLNTNFVRWVTIAFVIASPIAYFTMHKWLENFAYKTTLSWWIFALAGVLALAIALLTVSFQSWKAAVRNPIESLRYE